MNRRCTSGLATGAVLAVAAVASVGTASAAATGDLTRSADIDKPSVAVVVFEGTGYVNDNRDGKTYGPYDFSWGGTGFFISSDGYLVTAAHVAAPTQQEIKRTLVEQYITEDAHRLTDCDATGDCAAVIERNFDTYMLASAPTEVQTRITVVTQNMTPSNARTEGMVAEVKASSPDDQRDVAVIKVTGANFPVLTIGDSAKVEDQDPVAVIGFPGVADISKESSLVPTVTTGTITATKQSGPETGLAMGATLFQTDATIEAGNSGGPAIDRAGQVIGLVSFGATSTTNFLISSNDIRDTVRQSGAQNTQGRIDALWHEGLGYYDQQRYVRAHTAFQQCVALSRVQVGCADYENRAAGRLAQDQEARYTKTSSGGGFPVALVAGVAGGVVLLLGVLAVVVMRRRRGAPPATGAPAAVPPTAVAPPPPPPPPVPSAPPSAGVVPPPPPPPPSAWGGAAEGTPATHMPRFCPECGTPMSGAKVCTVCGHVAAPLVGAGTVPRR